VDGSSACQQARLKEAASTGRCVIIAPWQAVSITILCCLQASTESRQTRSSSALNGAEHTWNRCVP